MPFNGLDRCRWLLFSVSQTGVLWPAAFLAHHIRKHSSCTGFTAASQLSNLRIHEGLILSILLQDTVTHSI